MTHTARRRASVGIVASALLVATSFLGAPNAGSVTAPPVDQSSFGPIAQWSTVTGTDGRVYIADANGRALQFHGFNIKTGDPAADVTDDILAKAAARGMDHLRLSIFWQYIEPTQGNYDEAYLDEVRGAIHRAQAHGIRVILDMHQDVYGAAFNSKGAPLWATRTDGASFTPQSSWLLDYLQPAVQNAFDHFYEDDDLQQAYQDMWLKVVDSFKDEPGLLGYDLMNEPFGKMYPGEDLFTAAKRVESQQITPMYQRLTDAISSVDQDHWVFIEPPNLASLGVATSLGNVTGPRVAMYPHMYDTSLESSTYDPNSTDYTYDPAFFTNWANAITTYTDKYPMPMMIGEWGIALPEAHSMDAFVRDTLATLDRVSSGWSMFNFCEGSGYCPLDSSGNDRPNIGQIFEPYARAIAGQPTASTYDFATRQLKVTYRDNDATGATEIFVPESRSFPNGFKVLTSDDGASHTFDAETGVLSVTLPKTKSKAKTTGDHAICVVPSDSKIKTCVAPIVTQIPDGKGEPIKTPLSSAPAARAVDAEPTFTG